MTIGFDAHPVLAKELSVRVINVSATGCLIESRHRVEIGTIGTLQVRFGSEDCRDDVEVVRCDAVEGTPGVYHVGVRLLKTRPRRAGSIRYAVARQVTEIDRFRARRVM